MNRRLALLYLAAEQRLAEAVAGDHDGTCPGAGCSKCFLVATEPLMKALERSEKAAEKLLSALDAYGYSISDIAEAERAALREALGLPQSPPAS